MSGTRGEGQDLDARLIALLHPKKKKEKLRVRILPPTLRTARELRSRQPTRRPLPRVTNPMRPLADQQHLACKRELVCGILQ